MKILISIFLLFAFFACSDSSSNDDGVKIGDVNYEAAGVNEFLAKNYELSIKRFETGILKTNKAKIISRLIAYVGFAKLKLSNFNTEKYSDILSTFDQAIRIDENNLDAKYGKLLMHYVFDYQYAKIVQLASQILDANAAYQFALDSESNHYDVRVMKALAEFQLKDYDNAVITINTLTAFDISSQTDAEKALSIAKKLEDLILEYRN
jgi:tetratricopeptide (TPR) repeat protein